MSDSLYKVIELIGSSSSSWEEATKNLVERASQTLRDIRNVEVEKLDAKVSEGKIVSFRVKAKISFKFEK